MFLQCSLIIVVLLLVRNLIQDYKNKKKNYPKGPLGIPIFGSLFSMAKNIEQFQINIAKKYGSLVLVQIGLKLVIFANSTKVIKTLYRTKGVERKTLDHYMFNDFSIGEINGQIWTDRRKLIHRTFVGILTKEFINDSVNNTIKKYIRRNINNCIKESKLWYSKPCMQDTTFNLFYHSIFGEPADLDNDTSHKTLHKLVSSYAFELGKDFIVNMLKLPKWLSELIVKYITNIYPIKNNINHIISSWISKHENNGTKGLVQVIQKEIINNSSDKNFCYNKDRLQADIAILFAASVDSSSNSLEYATLMFAKYPKIQQQCYEELIRWYNHDNDNNNNNNNDNDNFKLFPYKQTNQLVAFRAFVHESLRLASAAPNGFPKQTNRDIEIEVDNKKYSIPKDTIIFPSIHFASRHNQEDWGDDTLELNLNHWINREGKFKTNDGFIIFSHGRDCVGKDFALKAIYTILGTLLLNYEFAGPNGHENFPITMAFGGDYSVSPHIGLQVKKRT